jgi:small GTP-binding protein
MEISNIDTQNSDFKSDNLNNLTSDNLTYEFLPDDFPQYDLTFKLIVIGDAFVGKSCLTSKATKNTFDKNYSATVGFEFLVSNIKINNSVCKMQIWDTCGQEVYRSLITNFYRNSSLAILVYSIDNYESFENVDLWLKELKAFSNPDCKVLLIGNKNDLEGSRKVDYETGEKFRRDNNLDFFIETSAKTGFNTHTVFAEAAKLLYLDHLEYKDKSHKSRCNSYGSVSSLGSNRSTPYTLHKHDFNKMSTKESIKKSGCDC